MLIKADIPPSEPSGPVCLRAPGGTRSNSRLVYVLANFGLVRSFSLNVSSEMFTAGLPSLWKPCTCRRNVLGVGARAALGKLRKGVLFSGNTKQEATGISIAFNSPARVHFQKFWQT